MRGALSRDGHYVCGMDAPELTIFIIAICIAIALAWKSTCRK
jgi:hypothetical protein